MGRRRRTNRDSRRDGTRFLAPGGAPARFTMQEGEVRFLRGAYRLNRDWPKDRRERPVIRTGAARAHTAVNQQGVQWTRLGDGTPFAPKLSASYGKLE
jgi:hypothetical protein